MTTTGERLLKALTWILFLSAILYTAYGVHHGHCIQEEVTRNKIAKRAALRRMVERPRLQVTQVASQVSKEYLRHWEAVPTREISFDEHCEAILIFLDKLSTGPFGEEYTNPRYAELFENIQDELQMTSSRQEIASLKSAP